MPSVQFKRHFCSTAPISFLGCLSFPLFSASLKSAFSTHVLYIVHKRSARHFLTRLINGLLQIYDILVKGRRRNEQKPCTAADQDTKSLLLLLPTPFLPLLSVADAYVAATVATAATVVALSLQPRYRLFFFKVVLRVRLGESLLSYLMASPEGNLHVT